MDFDGFFLIHSLSLSFSRYSSSSSCSSYRSFIPVFLLFLYLSAFQGFFPFFPCHASLSFASSYQVIDHRSPFFAATTVGKHEASRKRKNILDTCYRWKSLNPNKRTCISRYNSMLPSSRSFEIKLLIFLRIIDDLYFWLYHRMKEPHRLKLDDKIQLINIIV